MRASDCLRASGSPCKTAAARRRPTARAAGAGATPFVPPTRRGAASRSHADRATTPCAAPSPRSSPDESSAASTGWATYDARQLALADQPGELPGTDAADQLVGPWSRRRGRAACLVGTSARLLPFVMCCRVPNLGHRATVRCGHGRHGLSRGGWRREQPTPDSNSAQSAARCEATDFSAAHVAKLGNSIGLRGGAAYAGCVKLGSPRELCRQPPT